MKISTTLALIVTGLTIGQSAQSADSHAAVGYTDTPMLPGNKWHVHDPNRPQPRVVTPGTFSTQKEAGKPPSDAIVLIGPKDLSKWKDAKGEAPKWKLVDDYAVVNG